MSSAESGDAAASRGGIGTGIGVAVALEVDATSVFDWSSRSKEGAGASDLTDARCTIIDEVGLI